VAGFSSLGVSKIPVSERDFTGLVMDFIRALPPPVGVFGHCPPWRLLDLGYGISEGQWRAAMKAPPDF
jgi:hypothetical protein